MNPALLTRPEQTQTQTVFRTRYVQYGMTDHRCPDCDVAMREVDYSSCTHGTGINITDPDRAGVLARLGLTGTVHAHAYLCSECGLLRFYAPA